MAMRLYGEHPCVLVAALIKAVRGEIVLGKELVKKARENIHHLCYEDLDGIQAITGEKLESSKGLVPSANSIVMKWLRGGNTAHVEDLDHIFERFFLESVISCPETLSCLGLLEQVGICGHNAEWTNSPSLGYTHVKNRKMKHIHHLLQQHEERGIPEKHKVSFLVAKWVIENSMAHEKFEHHDYAIEQLDGIHSGIVFTMTELNPVRDLEDVKNYIQRLERVPLKLELVCQEIEYQKTLGIYPPRVCLEKVLNSIRQIRETFQDELEKIPLFHVMSMKYKEAKGEDLPKEMMEACRDALLNQVDPAYASLESCVESVLEETDDRCGVWKLPQGLEYYNWCLKHHTTTDQDAKSIHEQGLKEVQRLRTAMENVVRHLAKTDSTLKVDKSPIENLRILNEDPRFLYDDSEKGKQQALHDVQMLVDEIDSKISPHFDIRPKAELLVKQVPQYMEEGSPAAFYMPPSMDGARKGCYYANFGVMSAFLKYGLRTLTAHEAIPGHHFQIALANEMTSLPYFRRVDSSFTAFVEGWGLYAERLAQEVGFYQTEPDGTEGYDLLGHYSDEILRAARLVVDTGIHAQQWTRQQAMDYMTKNTNLPPSDVATEVDRYCVLPGQATAYKVGQLKILQVRQFAEANAQQKKFSLVDFHRILLTSGAVPLNVMEMNVYEQLGIPH